MRTSTPPTVGESRLHRRGQRLFKAYDAKTGRSCGRTSAGPASTLLRSRTWWTASSMSRVARAAREPTRSRLQAPATAVFGVYIPNEAGPPARGTRARDEGSGPCDNVSLLPGGLASQVDTPQAKSRRQEETQYCSGMPTAPTATSELTDYPILAAQTRVLQLYHAAEGLQVGRRPTT